MKKTLLPAIAIALLLASCNQPAEKDVAFTPPVIVKDETISTGRMENVTMEISSENGQAVVHVEKDGTKETIKMADWEANKTMYEKKYGELPPPPPPPPPPTPPPPPPPPPQPTVLIENVEFTPPNIVKDENIKMEVRSKNGQAFIYVEKNGIKETIKMSAWEANKAMYEKKYGALPPPPPPTKLPPLDIIEK